jgi:DNA polymerase-1
MNILALDTETTTWNKGNPYDSRNHLICYSAATSTTSYAKRWETSTANELEKDLTSVDLIIGFNFKFDLHWFLKEQVYQLLDKQIWDVQIAEFIISNQTHRFPSLNETCAKYGLGQKLDVIKEEYWDKGINTDEIPWEILSKYAQLDAELTLKCYHAQVAIMTPKQKTLCFLICQDLKILQEMEANGIPFDEDLCEERAKEVDAKMEGILGKLRGIYPSVPINFNSPEQLSSFLYGGSIKEEGKEHIGFFKTGPRAGQPKYSNTIIEHTLPRLYEPIRGSQMAKEGVFSTNEGTLRKLKGKKNIITMLLELSKLEKLNGTYYNGLISLRKEMNWPKGLLHGNFNQTTAQTGRLSSSRPNLQNFASELQDIFISEYSN